MVFNQIFFACLLFSYPLFCSSLRQGLVKGMWAQVMSVTLGSMNSWEQLTALVLSDCRTQPFPHTISLRVTLDMDPKTEINSVYVKSLRLVINLIWHNLIPK